MRHIAGWLALILLIGIGCQSTSLRSPQLKASQSQEWLKQYRVAQNNQEKNPNVACEIYTKLAGEVQFPLKTLSLIRAREVCTNAQQPEINAKQIPGYLRPLSLDIEWKVAEKGTHSERMLELALEKSKLRLPQTEKMKWMQKSIELAKALSLNDRLPEMEKRLFMIAPRLNPQPKREQWPAVAQDFRMSRKFATAFDWYEKIIADPRFTLNERMNAFRGLRLAHKNARLLEKHIEISERFRDFIFAQWKKKKKHPSLNAPLLDAEIYLARAQWTRGQVKDAVATLEHAEKFLKNRTSLAEVYWIRGRMSEEQGDLETVSKWMDIAHKEKISNEELRDKILWYGAWNEHRRQNFTKAADLLKELGEKTQSDVTKARTLYWQARCLQKLDRIAESKTVLDNLIQIDPLGYYGMIAHQQQGIAIALPKNPPMDLYKAQSESLSPLDADLADWLYWTGEKDVLTAYLDEVTQRFRRAKNQSEEAWTEIFKHYAKAGLFVKLYESLGTLDGERRKSILEHHPELLFPQPWSDEVRTSSLQFGVDEEFIYAIMRQESAFDPRARSGADAFGLMQVLPEVGQRMAEQHKLPYSDMDNLYEPKLNIAVGAAHLRELLTRHKGQFILAVASYNASENAIRNWMKMRFRGDSLEFIEEIPYEETRTYVRLVMRNMIFYRLLKSQSASIEFPAWVLNLDAS